MKLTKRILSLLFAAAIVLSLAACGGDPKAAGKTTITFMYTSSTAGMAEIKALVDQFNNTVGEEEGIFVKINPKTSAIQQTLPSIITSGSSPDIIRMEDRYFKQFTYYCDVLDDHISQEAVEGLFVNALDRYRYDQNAGTSQHDDPLYGVPYEAYYSVLYYNETALNKNGIICISVKEENLDAFNAGEPDENGKTKADYGIADITVPAKGFYRSESPYVPARGEIDGTSWSMPSDTEVLIFNNRISMNWDEVDDIAMVCSKEWNEASSTQYGFYTEWWFNYGWAVGADCIEDLTGDGDWVYSLPSNYPNYIVNEGKTYTGVYTGTVYQAGQTVGFTDIINAQPGDTLTCESDGNTTYYIAGNGTKLDGRDMSAQLADGTLSQLPSAQTALERFYSLAGEGGKNVCPYPASFGSISSEQYFANGRLAFLVELTNVTETISEVLEDDFKYAPLPVYKEYTDPTDPQCDTVKVQGKYSAHSNGTALMVSSMSKHKEEAYVFLEWVATEGQTWRAQNGDASARVADTELMKTNLSDYNPDIVIEAAEKCLPADWWYLVDSRWIDTWADPLNDDVRNGEMTFEKFIYAYVDKTNEEIGKIKN